MQYHLFIDGRALRYKQVLCMTRIILLFELLTSGNYFSNFCI